MDEPDKLPTDIPAEPREDTRQEDFAQHLRDIRELFVRQKRVEELVHRQDMPRHELVEQIVHNEHLAKLAQKLEQLHAADIAYILEALPLNERLMVWDLVKAERDGEILIEVSDAVRESLIESMAPHELKAAAEQLDADELADLAPDLPTEVMEDVFRNLNTEEREQLRAAMSYDEDAVGALMDFDMVTVREDVSLEVVLRYLRLFDDLPDQTDQLFVIDREDHLHGVLPVNALLINDPDTTVAAVMRRDALTLRPEDKAETAAQAFERYDLVSAPVVSSERQADRPRDRRCGARLHPRGSRSRTARAGRPERRGRHLRAGDRFGEEPLGLAGAQPRHRHSSPRA